MKTSFITRHAFFKNLPVVYITLLLGVVGLQVVFIAHTHMMIIGQPLLHGQDHHNLSHLPPFFLPTSPLPSSPVSADNENSQARLAIIHEDWDAVDRTPFLNMGSTDDSFIIHLEAPWLCASNIRVSLAGHDLAILAKTAPDPNGRSREWTRRVRFPGPLLIPCQPEIAPAGNGQWRITVRKAHPPDTESTESARLTLL